MKYPLSNYTIRVDNQSAHTIIFDDNNMIQKPSEEDGRVRVELNDTTLPGVTLDGSFALSVTACNDITCRKSNTTTFSEYHGVYGFPPSYHVPDSYIENVAKTSLSRYDRDRLRE
jgi:hypothetical protein